VIKHLAILALAAFGASAHAGQFTHAQTTHYGTAQISVPCAEPACGPIVRPRPYPCVQPYCPRFPIPEPKPHPQCPPCPICIDPPIDFQRLTRSAADTDATAY